MAMDWMDLDRRYGAVTIPIHGSASSMHADRASTVRCRRYWNQCPLCAYQSLCPPPALDSTSPTARRLLDVGLDGVESDSAAVEPRGSDGEQGLGWQRLAIAVEKGFEGANSEDQPLTPVHRYGFPSENTGPHKVDIYTYTSAQKYLVEVDGRHVEAEAEAEASMEQSGVFNVSMKEQSWIGLDGSGMGDG